MTKKPLHSFNPATGQKIWSGYSFNQEEVDAQVKKAAIAFKTWSILPLEQRIEHLRNFKSIIENQSSVFAESISIETGKPFWESVTEVQSVINKIDISIDAFNYRCNDFSYAFGSNTISYTRHKPHGVVAVLGPYNFPAHLPNGHIIPALIAGNTVVFKPSEYTPLVGELLMGFWKESGLPDGVLNLIQGDAETGKLIASHPAIDGLFFTGSFNTGVQLSKQFADTPGKILALEMGGNNPLVFENVKNIEAAVYYTIQSAYITSGQRCSAARRLIVVKSENSDTFVHLLLDQIKGLLVGAYDSIPEPFMGPLINEKTALKIIEAQNILINLGGKSLFPCMSLKAGTGLLSPGLIDVTDIKNKPDEEYFGPLLQLQYVDSLEEAINEANNTSYGLTAGILTDSKESYEQFFYGVKAGIINWNTSLTGANSAAPFGGVGKSGNNRPSALYAADYCSYPIASMESENLELPEKKLPGIYTRQNNASL